MSIEVLQYILIALAFVLWGLALAVAITGETAQRKIKKLFLGVFRSKRERTSVIDKNTFPTDEEVHDGEEIDDSEIDIAELRSLREQADEEKILFSESTLRRLIVKAKELGGPSKELMATLIEDAKATYPRVDGYVRINDERYNKLI